MVAEDALGLGEGRARGERGAVVEVSGCGEDCAVRLDGAKQAWELLHDILVLFFASRVGGVCGLGWGFQPLKTSSSEAQQPCCMRRNELGSRLGISLIRDIFGFNSISIGPMLTLSWRNEIVLFISADVVMSNFCHHSHSVPFSLCKRYSTSTILVNGIT